MNQNPQRSTSRFIALIYVGCLAIPCLIVGVFFTFGPMRLFIVGVPLLLGAVIVICCFKVIIKSVHATRLSRYAAKYVIPHAVGRGFTSASVNLSANDQERLLKYMIQTGIDKDYTVRQFADKIAQDIVSGG